MDTLITKILVSLIAVGSLFTPSATNNEILGTQVPTITAGFETSLQTSISSTDVTMTLASVTNRAGNSISGYKCFTVSEGTAIQEFVCGTATTSNQIISLVRGIDPENPSATSSTLAFAHRRGESVKETDYPILGILARQNAGIDGFPAVLKYDSVPTLTSPTQIPSKSYVDGIAIAGSPIMSTTLQGIAKISTAPASSTNPIVVGDNDTRIPTQAENDALAGTSPSGTNKYITFADATSTSASSSMIVRYTTTGQITATTTPVATTDATSKSYVDTSVKTFYGYATSTNLKFSADTERTESSTSYVKKKEIALSRSGKVRLLWDMKSTGNPSYSTIYINGVAYSGEYTSLSGTYETNTLDVTVNIPSLLQLYVKAGSGATAATRNFRVYYDIATTTEGVVTTD